MSEVSDLPKNRKEKGKALKQELFSAALNISSVESLTLPHLEADGNRELFVEGCKGIIAYEEGRIALNTGKLIITVLGSGIEIKAYSDTQTVISGDIMSIGFDSLQGE